MDVRKIQYHNSLLSTGDLYFCINFHDTYYYYSKITSSKGFISGTLIPNKKTKTQKNKK